MPRKGAKSSRDSGKVRIFRSLLLLSLLEGALWSLCLFHSASSAGAAYYQRETVNLKSTTAAGLPPLLLVNALGARLWLLALRDEAKFRQRRWDACASPPARTESRAQLAATVRAFQPVRGALATAEPASGAAARRRRAA